VRRLALIALALVAAVAWWVAGSAGASDSHTYKIEIYNAFGIVNGSQVRVAGVNAGTVTDETIDAKKRALLTVSLSGPLSTLGEDTRCSSQPQSLIAEYFIDCTPKGPPLEDGGTIPANHVRMTVQTDTVLNSLRQSYRERLTELINEFGTGLAGNSHSLNQAVRLGSPALFNLRKVLDILANQNATIRDLNVNSDRIVTQLAENRANVVKFIQTAGRTAAISASVRSSLAENFNRLDNFLHQLGPTMGQLAVTARQSTPLLTDLHAAAPGLDTLARNLPGFNRSTSKALTALGQASGPGRKALRNQAHGFIPALNRAAANAFPVGDSLTKFLSDLDSPSRAVFTDARAANRCPAGTSNPKSKPCYSTGRQAPTGYDGFENLLNWLYYLSGATNTFDQVGHATKVNFYAFFTGPCGSFNTGHNPISGAPGVPTNSGINNKTTTDITKTAPCVDWLGKNQPGINEQLPIPPYASSVCPNGVSPAAASQYCTPPSGAAARTSVAASTAKPATPATGSTGSGSSGSGGGGGSSGSPPSSPPPAGAPPQGGQGPVPGLPPGLLPQTQEGLHKLEQILGLPPGTLGGLLGGQGPGATPNAAGPLGTPGATKAAQNVLQFLMGD
jgi:ABC-type transporter Mla subunit MlaD